jgi:hypothetical protein
MMESVHLGSEPSTFLLSLLLEPGQLCLGSLGSVGGVIDSVLAHLFCPLNLAVNLG